MALTDKLTAIADAIRSKTGSTEELTLDQMAIEIEGIQNGGGEEWFNDGDTHIWISLAEGRTSPMLGIGVNGTVTVDWGDGSEPDVLTGTMTGATVRTPNHEYSKAGDYIIRLTIDGNAGFNGVSSPGASILCHSSSPSQTDNVYLNSIRKIEVCSNITSIGNYAFSNCSSLQSIIIPDSVTKIGNNAFNNCSALLSIDIPDGVISIGDYAFNYCYSLLSVTIPDSVTSIGNSAFNTCRSLRSITIPDGIKKIGSSTFNNCRSLSSIVIPYGLTDISSSYAFSYCHSLASIIIPGSVKSIGTGAFSNCYGIRFYDFSKHTAVPSLSGTDVFTGISTDCEIRVPAALYDEWIAATNWSSFASQIVAV